MADGSADSRMARRIRQDHVNENCGECIGRSKCLGYMTTNRVVEQQSQVSLRATRLRPAFVKSLFREGDSSWQ